MNKNSTKTDLDNFSTNSLALGDNISIDGNFGLPQSSFTSDQCSKYDKLVQDYVKLRSKLTIVKKAYIELSESSAQKDQSIRKYEQELEGLNFRNQQLTSRVEILQRELEPNLNGSHQNPIIANSSSNTNLLLSSSTSSSSSTLSTTGTFAPTLSSQLSKAQHPQLEILTEELEHKINENQTLHRRLSELEVDLRQKLVKNEQSLKQIEYEKLLLEKKLEAYESSSKSVIEKLENDKIKLELNVIQLENQLRSTHQEKELKESELMRKESEHSLLIQQNAELHKNSSSSSLSLSSVAKKESNVNQQQELFINCLKSNLDCLNKMFTCLVERLDKQGSSKLALKCEQMIQQIQNKFKTFNLNQLDQLINGLCDSNHKLLQSIINDFSTSKTSGNKNEDMEKLRKKVKIYLNKLDQFLYSDESESENFICNVKILVNFYLNSSEKNSKLSSSEKFLQGLKSLVDLLDKLLFALNEKLSLEYSLNYLSDITTNDECLVSYLTQIKQSLSQLAGVAESVDLFEIIVNLKNEQNETLVERETFTDPKEIEGLKQTIMEKESELSEFRERYESLRLKSEKDFEDVKDLRSRLEKLQARLVNMEDKEKLNEQEISSLKSQTTKDLEINENENKNQANIEGVEKEEFETIEDIDKQLEKPTLEIYEKQMEILNKRIQFLDSKAFYYYDETKCMLERLKLQMSVNNVQGHDLTEIKDQLDRTRSSYEMQMSTMSDHLIEMNDRMTKQAEENERLKHELNSTSQANSKSSKTKKSK